MSLVTTAHVQALGIGLDLTDATLQAVIDREESELVRRYGSASAARTETLDGEYERVFVKRQVSSVTTITETSQLGDTPDTLAATDYHIRALMGTLTRLPEGQFWGREVAITYTPVDDTNLRTEVLIELVRIATAQAAWGDGSAVSGLSFKVVTGIATAAEWAEQRAAQYARMGGLAP